MTGSTEGKGPGAGAPGKDKAQDAQAKNATGKGADGGPGPGQPGDSPKRQGDKLEHATQAAAGKPERS